MSNTLSSKDFGLKLYNRFPHKYREDDVDQNYALRRYLESLADGGFSPVIEETNGILSLVDPDTVRADILPILFKQYGLEVFNGIPEQYLRYLLPNLGEAWSKKGSISVVEYITSSLSGMRTSTDVVYDENEDTTVEVKLEMDSGLDDYVPNGTQFKRLLENFVPFYCDILLIYVYLFIEGATFTMQESGNNLKITDTKTDLVELNAFIEECKQRVREVLTESSEITFTEVDKLKYILRPIVDDIRVRFGDLGVSDKLSILSSDNTPLESVEDIIKQSITTKPVLDSPTLKKEGESHSCVVKTSLFDELPRLRLNDDELNQYSVKQQEVGRIRLRHLLEEPELDSTFGYLVFGSALFNYGQETSDTISDSVHFLYAEVDDINIECSVSHYDVIIVNGNRQEVIYS